MSSSCACQGERPEVGAEFCTSCGTALKKSNQRLVVAALAGLLVFLSGIGFILLL